MYSEVISTSGSAAVLSLTVENVAHCLTIVKCCCFSVELIFGFGITLSLKLAIYYYFRFLSNILIFGRKRCRPLLLEVTYTRGLFGSANAALERHRYF